MQIVKHKFLLIDKTSFATLTSINANIRRMGFIYIFRADSFGRLCAHTSIVFQTVTIYLSCVNVIPVYIFLKQQQQQQQQQ